MSTLSITDLRVDVQTETGPKEILKGVNLTVRSGEVHAIMGPNGSGKSTLAYAIAGHPKYTITGGSVKLDDVELTELTVDERARAGLFLAMQYPIEVPGVSVTNFLRTAKTALDGQAPKVRTWPKVVSGALTRLEMDPDFATRSVNEGFSGGEKKRNEIFQLAVLEPKLAILDETDSGLDIDALKNVADGVNALRSPDRAFVVITHYQRLLDYIQPDVVHAVNPAWLAAYGVLSAKRRDIPLLASYHTQLSSYVEKLHLGWLTRPADWWTTNLHNQAEVNLCTSPQMVASAIEHGVGRVDLWPKAVDTTTYHPGARTKRMRRRLTDDHPEMPLAIYVGRLSNEKNLDDLLEPVHRMPHVRFAFVGSGPASDRLKSAFSGTQTVFTGYLTGHELAEAYASADVFCFPSTTETLGFAGLEAMASGVPVIGADAGGIPHLFTHGTEGFLFEPHNADRIVELLGLLTDDPALRARMGEAARAEAERHGWRAATDSLLRFYGLAIERHGRS